MPDLAAAIAEWEEARKPLPRKREREPTPAPALPEPERAPVLPGYGDIVPCMVCTHPQAAAAVREVLNVYVAACRGEPHRTGGTLPRACCRWQQYAPSVEALIG
jgi:hypothetical protein